MERAFKVSIPVLDPFAKQVDFELHFSDAINVLLGGFHPLSFLLVLAYKKMPAGYGIRADIRISYLWMGDRFLYAPELGRRVCCLPRLFYFWIIPIFTRISRS
jgi:hypothetical protein